MAKKKKKKKKKKWATIFPTTAFRESKNTPLPSSSNPDNAGDLASISVNGTMATHAPGTNSLYDDSGDPIASPNRAALIPGLSLVNDDHSGRDLNGPVSSGLTDKNRDVENLIVVSADAIELEGTANNQVREKVVETEASLPVLDSKNEVATQDAVDQHLEIKEPADDQDNEGDEHPEWEIDSSPYESSSDDSTTDSSDGSDDDDDDYPILSPEEQARILMQAEGSDDEGDGKGKGGGRFKTTNELPEEVPPIPDIKVTPDMKVTFLGNVTSIVDNSVLIEAHTSGEYQVLEFGSLLCFEDRSVAGVVSETLGRVEKPLYASLYPTSSEIEMRGLSRGKPVYYVDDHSTFVFTQPLRGIKGSDASNFHDEEIGEDEIEFSDDEAEAQYKRKMKQRLQEKKEAKFPTKSNKKKSLQGPSKLKNQTELNYDDDAGGDVPEEDGYTPLARPQNLHELMAYQEETLVEDPDYPGQGGFRGNRRGGREGGFERGRRGRGRGGQQGESRQELGIHLQSPHQQQQLWLNNARVQPSNYSPGVQPLSAQQQAYGVSPQQFTPFTPYLQQPPHQTSLQAQFPFQLPHLQSYQQAYQQAYRQFNPYQQCAPGAHINSSFLAALQQQRQWQQYQSGGQTQEVQNQALSFEQVKTQLDILQQLNQMPRS